jgi:hypothetical protein
LTWGMIPWTCLWHSGENEMTQLALSLPKITLKQLWGELKKRSMHNQWCNKQKAG